MSRIGQTFVVAAVLGCFSLGVALKLHAPLTFWDSALIQWALSATQSEAPTLTSPLYLASMKLMAGLDRLEVTRLRKFNAAGAVLTGIFAFCLGTRLWGCSKGGMVAFSMYMLHPATIQGTQSLDGADSSYLPAAFALWVFALLSPRLQGWKRGLVLMLCSAWAMGWKITSSLGLLLYLIPLAIFRIGDKSDSARSRRDLFATLAGFLLFAIPWWSLQPWTTLQTSVISALYDLRIRPDATLLRTIFHTGLGFLWLGPFLAVMALSGAISLFRQNDVRLKAVIAGTAVYGFVYLLAGGMNHGFPRYHAAVLPIVCAIAATPAPLQSWKRRNLLVLLLLTLLLWVLAGDPIYTFNLGARQALLEARLWPYAVKVIYLPITWAVIAVVAKRAFSLSWPEILLLAALANSVTFMIVQGRAAYVTCYDYGEEGRQRVVDWIKRTLPAGSSVLCPPNVTAELWQTGVRGPSHRDWQTKESVLAFTERAAPSTVVVSLTENTAWQLKWLLQDPPARFANCAGRYFRIGTYWVCAP
ncbi:MAG: hypothetical protein HY644_10000 [Acidobacteria bacterium]|nr:hypothetical protein [Acidobacteriota bacterium]